MSDLFTSDYDPLHSAHKAWIDLLEAGPLWGKLLKSAGLEIDSASEQSFQASLEREIPVNRTIPGFEDFAEEGKRGIEPGVPAHSLLYHAMASNSVITWEGQPLRAFPTLQQIDSVENYVYGARRPSMAKLRALAGGAPLAIAVFAYEYRPAAHTVHRKHADMCFSRTGLARVGIASNEYLGDVRGFLPSWPGDDDTLIRVLPCRYAAFVAARLSGDRDNFGPMRYRGGAGKDESGKKNKSDRERFFWVPLHKLFDGDQCISGHSLQIQIHSSHVNEKLRRFHIVLQGKGYDSGHTTDVLDGEPFLFRDQIAVEERVGKASGGLVVMPCVNKSLVERARTGNAKDGPYLTYNVPRIPFTYLTSLWNKPPDDTNRACPEFINAATAVVDGTPRDLNADPDFVGHVRTGGYDALHFTDFTGDGYVKATCSQLRDEIPNTLAAYSIVAPPDFFPLVTQRDLADWFDGLPDDLRSLIWSKDGVNPEPLSDARLPANLEIKEAGFQADDDTITAVVSGLGSGTGRSCTAPPAGLVRASCLPDHAAGLFAPGWDTSQDIRGGVEHLAAYGLGSPFPEDMKLCAALSAFWPAATPDTTRFYPQGSYRSTTPLPDEYEGWDEVPLPVPENENPNIMEYASLGHADYVGTADQNRFRFGLLSQVTLKQYTEWTLVMARVHLALGANTPAEAAKWYVPSFRKVSLDDSEFEEAVSQSGVRMDPEHSYRVFVFKGRRLNSTPSSHPGKMRVAVDQPYLLFADTETVLKLEPDKPGLWSEA